MSNIILDTKNVGKIKGLFYLPIINGVIDGPRRK